MLIRFLALILTLIEDATAQARRLFAYLKTTASRRAATVKANPLVQQLMDEIRQVAADPRRYGNRATRRRMDSLYFRHRSKGRPIMAWDATISAFCPAPRRRVLRWRDESERFREALRRMHLRRKMSLRRAMLRARKQEARNQRLRLAALRAAVAAIDGLRDIAAAASASGRALAGMAEAGAKFYDKANQRVLRRDENGDLRLIAEGPLAAVVPVGIGRA